MSDSRFPRTYLPLTKPQFRPAAAGSSDFPLLLVAYLALGAVLVLAGLVGLTIAHAVLTTALNLGLTLDAVGRQGGGW